MTMNPGSSAAPAGWEGSLAAAIETALGSEMALAGRSLPSGNELDRRMLFAAIAQGVLLYLKDHASDIHVAVTGVAGASASVSLDVEQP